MSDRRAQYHLRIQLRPSPDIARRAEALAQFCIDCEIEEAVLFVDAETANNGFLSAGETEDWRAALQHTRDELLARGIAVSLNPWYTVLHTDRGRHQPEGWSFTPMVSPTGEVARTVASFACPRWQQYIAQLYGALSSVGFRVVWIEDDFRYHNHAPLPWGGDFSSAMLSRFAAKVGREVGREEVVANILRPGEPHPWRGLWQETWQDAQIEAASAIRDAVLAADSSSLLGLMSSHPSSHSQEGRDWDRLFRSIEHRGRTVHRPHFAGYQDSTRADLARSSFLLDYQKNLRPADLNVEVTPEIENYPMTPFSKSDTVTWGQMALAQIHGADAQMLDIFSFEVHHIEDEPWVGPFLNRVRPGLDELARAFPASLVTSGVGVLWRPDAALHVRTSGAHDLSELWVPLTPAADVLQAIGVAVQARPGSVNCLWGTVAWAYPDDELRALLAGRLWLDAEAASVLQQRGLGAHLPVAHGHWWGREEMNYSLERPAGAASGLEPHLSMSVNAFGRVAYQTLRPGAEEWTSLCDPHGVRLGPALTVSDNDLGGRVAVSALPLAGEPSSFTLSVSRQRLIQGLIRHLAPEGALPALVEGSAFTFPVDMHGGDTRRVALFNASLDGQRPIVHLNGAAAVDEARLLTAEGPGGPLAHEVTGVPGGLDVRVTEPLPFCGVAVLTLV